MLFQHTYNKGNNNGLNYFELIVGKKRRIINFPKELELTSEELEQIKNSKSTISILNRETGEMETFNVSEIPEVGDLIQTGTFDAPQKDLDDVVDENVIILDLMPMAKSKYGNRWYLALCADPTADTENDDDAYFTLPFGGQVVTEKLHALGGYRNFERDENKARKLPVLVRVVKVPSSDPAKQDYFDFVSPSTSPEETPE